MCIFSYTVKPVLSGQSKRVPKIGFQDRLLLNAGQEYCRMLQESILQYFRASLSYHLSLRPLFCLFLSGCLRQVLLYMPNHILWVLKRTVSMRQLKSSVVERLTGDRGVAGLRLTGDT